MRIRKILPLALLAIGTTFALTSCDKLLDAIFPTNTIYVTVQAPIVKYTGYQVGGAVTVILTSYGGTTYQAGPAPYSYPDIYGNANYTFSFAKLPNDTYTLQAYYLGYYYNGVATVYGYGPTQTAFYDPLNTYTNAITMPYSHGGSPNSASIVVVLQ